MPLTNTLWRRSRAGGRRRTHGTVASLCRWTQGLRPLDLETSVGPVSYDSGLADRDGLMLIDPSLGEIETPPFLHVCLIRSQTLLRPRPRLTLAQAHHTPPRLSAPKVPDSDIPARPSFFRGPFISYKLHIPDLESVTPNTSLPSPTATPKPRDNPIITIRPSPHSYWNLGVHGLVSRL